MNTVHDPRAMGIHDRDLWRLQQMVAEHIAVGGQAAQAVILATDVRSGSIPVARRVLCGGLMETRKRTWRVAWSINEFMDQSTLERNPRPQMSNALTVTSITTARRPPSPYTSPGSGSSGSFSPRSASAPSRASSPALIASPPP